MEPIPADPQPADARVANRVTEQREFCDSRVGGVYVVEFVAVQCQDNVRTAHKRCRWIVEVSEVRSALGPAFDCPIYACRNDHGDTHSTCDRSKFCYDAIRSRCAAARYDCVCRIVDEEGAGRDAALPREFDCPGGDFA